MPATGPDGFIAQLLASCGTGSGAPGFSIDEGIETTGERLSGEPTGDEPGPRRRLEMPPWARAPGAVGPDVLRR